MGAETDEIVERAMAAYEADDLDTQLEILDPDVELVEWPTRIGFFTTEEPALRAAGLDESSKKAEEAR
jgi:hypothetical protein